MRLGEEGRKGRSRPPLAGSGVALNRQIDCDNRIFGKPQYKSPDLSKKLLALGLDQGKTSRLFALSRRSLKVLALLKTG